MVQSEVYFSLSNSGKHILKSCEYELYQKSLKNTCHSAKGGQVRKTKCPEEIGIFLFPRVERLFSKTRGMKINKRGALGRYVITDSPIRDRRKLIPPYQTKEYLIRVNTQTSRSALRELIQT